MEKLTDKPDWNKKVFDEEIVAKWRAEALVIPSKELWALVTSGKNQYVYDGGVLIRDDSVFMEEKALAAGIMNEVSFDFVSFSFLGWLQ